MRHGVLYFPYSCRVGTSETHDERQVEGETDEDILLQVERELEKYYIKAFNNKPDEVMLAICEDGAAIDMERLGNKYSVKISISMMLEPKKEKPIRRAVKKGDVCLDDYLRKVAG
jgi:hypothetical protein